MKNNKKMTLKTKDEKRRLAFEKRNVKKEQNRARYGAEGGSALVMAKTTEFNRRIIAAVLALVFVISTLALGMSFAGRAEEIVAATANMRPEAANNKGLVSSKQLSINDNNLYDLTLSSYATGEKIEKQTPTDFIFVMDQSGSMSIKDMPTDYDNGTTARWNIKQDEFENDDDSNNAQYIRIEENDGSVNYYRVYRKRGYMYEYHPKDTYHGGNITDVNNYEWFNDRETEENEENEYYYNDGTGYYPVKISIKGKWLRWEIRFYYYKNNEWIQISRVDNPIDQYESFAGWLTNNPIVPNDKRTIPFVGPYWYDAVTAAINTVFPNGSDAWLYGSLGDIAGNNIDASMYMSFELYHRHVGYNELCYRDKYGEEHTLIKSEFCSATQTDGTVIPYGGAGGTTGGKTSKTQAYWNGTLCKATDFETRLESTQRALTSFINQIAEQTDSYGAVDHRVAIVGFSGSNNAANTALYKNTELLTGTNLTLVDDGFQPVGGSSASAFSLDDPIRNHNGVQLADASQNDYDTALLQASDAGQKQKLLRAATALTAYGDTYAAPALNAATEIINSRYNAGDYDDGKRNVVVVYFTDGRPGITNSNQYAEANAVVEAAAGVKATNDGNTTVYSIGMFGEADGNPLTYYDAKSYISDANYLKISYRQDYVNSSVTATSTSGTKSYRIYYKQWFDNQQGYVGQENDTISDYMEVVSSNYPEAVSFSPATGSEWIQTGFTSTPNSAYSSTVDGQNYRGRTAAYKLQGYYKPASSSDSLLSAFNDIFTSISEDKSNVELDAAHSLIADTISGAFDVTIPVDNDNNVTGNVTVKTYQCMSINSDNEPSFSSTGNDFTNAIVKYDPSEKMLTVQGFDYTTTYVAQREQSSYLGEKIEIVIHDLSPNTVGDILKSNGDNSGIYRIENQTETLMSAFPQPSISRHSYTLNVGSDNPSAVFDLATNLMGTGSTLEDVIIVVPEIVSSGGESTTILNRYKYSSFISGHSDGALGSFGDGTTYYYENVPTGYNVQTKLTTSDDTYTYHVAYDDGTSATDMQVNTPLTKSYSFDDHVLGITATANNRTVTIKEAVDGSFANNSDYFTPTLYLVPPEGQQVPSEGATYGNVTWKEDVNENRLKYTTRAIQGNNSDSVSLTVPANWKLVVDQTDDNYYEVTDKEYVLGTSGTSTDIPPAGVVISDNMTVTITNTRDNIPVTGVNDSSNFNWIIYILVALGGLAVIGAGIFLWKKRNEFVEE